MRRKKNIKRELRPDPIYGSFLVSQFTKALMYGGKKSTAYKVLLDTLEELKKAKKGENPVLVLETAVNNVAPNFENPPKKV